MKALLYCEQNPPGAPVLFQPSVQVRLRLLLVQSQFCCKKHLWWMSSVVHLASFWAIFCFWGFKKDDKNVSRYPPPPLTALTDWFHDQCFAILVVKTFLNTPWWVGLAIRLSFYVWMLIKSVFRCKPGVLQRCQTMSGGIFGDCTKWIIFFIPPERAYMLLWAC